MQTAEECIKQCSSPELLAISAQNNKLREELYATYSGEREIITQIAELTHLNGLIDSELKRREEAKRHGLRSSLS